MESVIPGALELELLQVRAKKAHSAGGLRLRATAAKGTRSLSQRSSDLSSVKCAPLDQEGEEPRGV